MPSTRKHHRHPVPLVGGVAMCIAFCIGILLLPEKPEAWLVLLSCMILLTLVGLYDDLYSSPPTARFMLQAVAVLLMAVVGGEILNDLGDLLGIGTVKLGWAALPFTLFGVIGVINAFNMIDGLDGLAGGSALVATVWLIVLCWISPISRGCDIEALLVLSAAIAGFLVYNLRHPWRARASVFMGDAGSTMLGFVLSWYLIHLSQGEQSVMEPITAVWILALPLMDTISVMVRRLQTGQSPFAADRQHLHHLLLGFGFQDGQAVAVVLIASFVFGGFGVAAHWLGISHHSQFYAFVVLFLLYFQITKRIAAINMRDRSTVGQDRRRHRQEEVGGKRKNKPKKWYRILDVNCMGKELD